MLNLGILLVKIVLTKQYKFDGTHEILFMYFSKGKYYHIDHYS